MAKDNSFDIVSETDMQEVENAFNNTEKGLKQRYDLKDSGSKVDFDKGAKTITVLAPSDFVSSQVIDVLNTNLIKRKVDLKAIKWGHAPGRLRQDDPHRGRHPAGYRARCRQAHLQDIKAEKFKVKVQIESDKLRVSGPKRDDLQEVISFLREQDYGIPLQFANYR